jgi:amino acid adenylation domain-containing protein
LILHDLEQIISGRGATQRPQFEDVLKHQLQCRLEPASEEAHKYWQDHLQDIKPANFPKLLTKQLQRSGRQACTRAFTLNLHDLTSTCRRLYVSRQSFVSAAFALLLSSYVGNPDVVFGAVSSGRTIPIHGIERIIGPCISTFPMRLDLSRLRTARDVINSTHRQHHNFLQFDDITLADIKTLSGIAGGNALFDSLFVWQEGYEASHNSERVLSIVDTFDSLDYAVVLEIEPGDGKLQAKFSFETSKVSADHAMLFLNQLDSLLTLFARVPETLVRDCYSDMKMEEASIENADFFTFDESFTLTSTIDALAKEDPSRTAIEFVDAFDPQSGQLKATTISYGNLYRRSSHVSQSLAAKGVSPDAVISIVMEKSIDLYVAILGVIRSGAAYLAIDPRTPADRARKIIKDSRCRIVISEDLSRDSAGSCEFYSTSELESRFGDISPAVGPSLDSRGGNLAYAVYTSGSTGVPKGVLITRSNLLSNIDCLSRLYPSKSDSKLLQACSQAFDVSVFEIFFTWHMGMSLCVAANDMLFRDIEYLIRRMNVSHLSLTPSVAALIEPENVPNVKFLVTAGEPMNSKVFNSWTDRGLYQGYGPSETTNICNVRSKVALGDFPNNVGLPLPNTSIFICQGQNFSIVPKGAVGEIWIGGDQVGRGYLYNEELTLKSFVDHATYGRLYRSGDIGRLLADGSLVILGRHDDQVKLRGQRIELGDINHALIGSVMVKDAATLIVGAASDRDARLVSFWTPDVPTLDDTIRVETQTRALLADLEARLPPYMIPDVLIPIDHVPLTRQGKIDRRKLIEQFEEYSQSLLQRFSRANEQEEYSGVLSQQETLIAQGVADVIGCAPSAIHRDASFFGLGMDSIKAIKLSQKLRKIGFGQVDISKILRHASVRRLAIYLSSASASVRNSIDAPQQPRTGMILNDDWQRYVKAQFADVGYNVARILPSNPLQEVMLSSYDIHRGNSYQNQSVFRISGDLAELELSWKAMLSRHQLLSTGFAMTASSASAFAQVVLENFTLPWSWGDNDEQPGRNLEGQLHEGCVLPPYSLKASQDRNGGNSTLTLRMHHALYDGEAMSLLLREVETHYLGRWLPPVVPFDHYIEYMLSLDQALIDNFWQSQLEGHTSQLLTDIFSSATQEDRQTHFTTQIVSRVPFNTFEAELKRMSTTLLGIVQTSWARLLSSYLQTFDVCFGNVYSGRSIPIQDADQIIGPCFNTLPLRVELKKLQTTAELSQRLQETNTVVLPYQPSSLRRIQKNHGAIERPLFDTLLLLQPALQPLNANIWTLVEEIGDMDFPVICEVVPDAINDRLQLRLHVQSGHVPAPEARRLLENFDLLLQNDVQYSQTSSRDFSILKDNLPSVPRSPTIKIISPSSLEEGHPADSAEEPFSSLETKIRQILSEASETGLTHIKKLTSIFQLGLDSIDAVQIAARLRREGFNVTGGDILEAYTIEGIAGLCSKHSASPKKTTLSFDLVAFDTRYRSGACRKICVPPATVEAIYPCTSTQSGILAEFIHSDGRFYFNTLTLRLIGIVEINRLKEAWVHVVARHEILRTGFVEIENADHPFAMITYRPSIHQLPWKESARLDDAPGSDVDGKIILQSLHQPPWYLLYSKQGDNCLLKLSILHALYDAQSLDLILADVVTLYNGNDLPPLKRIHTALSSILSQSLIQDQESESFFTTLGKSLQTTRFPDLRIYNNELHGVSVVAQSCNKSQHELRQGCKQAGMSLQTAIHCAWAQLLAAYTGDPDVTFGIVLSGRTSGERKDSVAFPTMNTLPMPLHVSKDAGDLVGQASKLNAALLQRQFVPLTKIKKWLNVKESLFDTIVVLQQYSSSSDGIALWEIVSDEAQTEHAVSLEVVPDNQDRVTLRLTFQRNILPPEQAKIILDQCEALLSTIIFPPHAEKDPQIRRRHELFSITPAKQGRIATSMRLLHEMVEGSAQIWPEHTALEFAASISDQLVLKRCWTYKSLDKEANKIAHFLIQQGASLGDMIGVCFDKCPEASFAILGILKSTWGTSQFWRSMIRWISPQCPLKVHIYHVSSSQRIFVIAFTRQERLANLRAV